MKKFYQFLLTLFVAVSIDPIAAQCTLFQGPDSGSTFVNDPFLGTYPWAGPQNARSSDNNYALLTMVNMNDQTQLLKATGFGFSIPLNATICGIVVKVERSKIGMPARDGEILAVKNNSIIGINHASLISWPDGVDSVMTYGSNSDLWGTTWTPAEINATGFGAAVQAINMGNSSCIPRVDQIIIRVYYSTSTGVEQTADSEGSVTVSPNPSSGLFTVTANGLNSSGSVLEVFNEIGEKIYTKPFNGTKTELDLSAKPGGIYFLRVISAGKITASVKLINR